MGLTFDNTSRALSLRNLVSGYVCGMVFPAVVGPGSPSRDAANWLLSRFGLSVETRRRYGCLRMVFPGVRLFRAPIFGPFRRVAARERQRVLSRRAWLFSIGWVRTRFGEGRGQLDRRRARGGLNPCARESKARTGRFLNDKLMSDHGHFSSYEGHKERRTGKIRGLFQGYKGLWTAGCWLERRLHQLKASTTTDLGISIFLIFVRCMALRNLDLLIEPS